MVKHFDAYADVDWDHPDNANPGTQVPTWFKAMVWRAPTGIALPADTRARIGLHGITSNMKVGLQFENVLKRGLLV